MSKDKLKVAFFDFTGCEGCQLSVLNFENELLDILKYVDIVEFREAIDNKTDEYDIAFCEGSISTPSCIERIHDVRRRSEVLVAIGACATLGGINALKNLQDTESVRETVYGKDKYLFPTIPAQPIDAIVKVDYKVHGCPMTPEEFIKIFKALVMHKIPVIPDYSVCVECKLKENECLFDKGMFCLGPITRAGCGARCPSFGQSCIGCRGMVDDPNQNAQLEVLKKYGFSIDEVRKRMNLFNAKDVKV
ncbi:MAG: NADH:ubiquinone oxidoreductase [Candidatus Neomarinimicrobiota bacterium]|nr:MAG: NADH:ubiquinone oxidoreductase [Candidatus Neomarinimicrobiota bacterium]